MTPVELNERLVGFRKWKDVEWQRLAKLFSYVITALTGKRFKARALLPEVFPVPPIYTKEERLKELYEIKEEVGLN